MKKWICSVCGYNHEGENAPDQCPNCGAPSEKFNPETSGELVYADEHQIGIAQGVDNEVLEGLRQNFNGECMEVGMYLAMSRQAEREGYAEIAATFKKFAYLTRNYIISVTCL